MNGDVFRGGIPGVKSFNLAQALHGEQYVELLKPIPSSGTYGEHWVCIIVDEVLVCTWLP